jgi:hypothetical protein
MNRNLLSVLMLLFFASTSFGAPLYSPITGHWYERIDKQISWVDAKLEAENSIYRGMQGYLATITSAQENLWIVNNLGGALTLDHWLGGYRDLNSPDPNSGWHWVTGEAWFYTNWWPGEPSSIYENALQFDDDERTPSLFGYWNDLDRNNPEQGYIVEYGNTPVPEPSSLLLFGSGFLGYLFTKRKLFKNHM